MERLVLDPAIYAPFFTARSNLELCDDKGRTLGYFVPADTVFINDPALYEWAKAQISDEELDRRRAEPGPLRTTAQVLARLEQL